MNQYIITEEKLAEIESTPNEDTKDWLRIFYGLCDGVRSHPYQSERDTVLDETSNGVVLWSPAHIFRLICRLDETELEYLLSDIRWLQERNFKRNHPELRQAGEP